MNDISDMTKTIVPRSDQLNADDLLAGPITVTVKGVRLSGNPDQPTIIDIGDGRQPYKPCKSMGRVLVFCWGKDGNQWIGRKMTLYCDPTVTWAGQAVGGIRISHLSDIDKQMSVSITVTRGKRKPYQVEPLTIPEYSQAEFDKNLPAWAKAINAGKATAQEIIDKVQQKGLLSEPMKQAIIAMQNEQQADQPDDDL
jgi:hypothetical protein